MKKNLYYVTLILTLTSFCFYSNIFYLPNNKTKVSSISFFSPVFGSSGFLFIGSYSLKAGATFGMNIALENIMRKVLTKFFKNVIRKTTKKLIRHTSKEIVQELIEEFVEEAAEQTFEESVEQLIEKLTEEIIEEITELISSSLAATFSYQLNQAIFEQAFVEAVNEESEAAVQESLKQYGINAISEETRNMILEHVLQKLKEDEEEIAKEIAVTISAHLPQRIAQEMAEQLHITVDPEELDQLEKKIQRSLLQVIESVTKIQEKQQQVQEKLTQFSIMRKIQEKYKKATQAIEEKFESFADPIYQKIADQISPYAKKLFAKTITTSLGKRLHTIFNDRIKQEVEEAIRQDIVNITMQKTNTKQMAENIKERTKANVIKHQKKFLKTQ